MTRYLLCLICLIAMVSIAAAQETDSLQQQNSPAGQLGPREIHQIMWDQLRPRLALRQAMSLAQAAKAGSNWQEYDMRYYNINLRIDHVAKVVYGRVGTFGNVAVTSLDSIAVDLLSNMAVDSIYNESGLLTFSHPNDVLTIHLERAYAQGERFHFTVVYHGTPTGTGFQGFSFSTRNSKPLITTLSEPMGARSWWPCNDIPRDKADSVDMIVTVDTSLKVSSNGLVISDVNNGDATHTVHWHEQYPITTYLVSLALYPYSVWDSWYHYGSNDSMLLRFHVYPDQLSASKTAFAILPAAIGDLASRFGEYPFIAEKYGLTHFDWGGAMEHQTNTSTEASSFGNSASVIVHELGHQWWGDMVTCDDWHHIWMNEGFATYSEALYFEITTGVSYYHSYMNSMEFTSGGSIYISDTTNVNTIFGSIVYDKGGWVLHMLRHIVGDAAFFQGLLNYRNQYMWSTATTEDFRQVMEQTSGMDLSWFFQEWIYGTYRPTYYYSYLSEAVPDGGYITYLTVRQAQSTSPQVFTMPVDIRITSASTTTTQTIFNNQRSQNFTLMSLAAPTAVAFDPDRWISRVAAQESYTFHIVTDSLENGLQATSYHDTVLVKGGNNNYECAVIAGALPSGFSLASSTGIITGTTPDTGTFTFTVRATDQLNSAYKDSMVYVIHVAPTADRPGDANCDGIVDVGDIVYLINYIFKSGASPLKMTWADANNDCVVNVGDPVYLINFVFKGGLSPVLGCAK